jgi:replication factor A1
MSLEDVVKRILLFRPDLSRKEVLKRIEEKKKGVEGYLTDETAARIVATELGVEVPRENFKTEILIKDVVSGLNDVTVTGRIITVHSPQTFTRSDMTKGTVAHLLMADKTGTIRVVLWDDRTSLVETRKLVQGQIIKVSHAYVREGLDGKPELHVGLRGEIQVSPSNVKDSDYPKIRSFIKKIAEIRKKMRASVLGIVQQVYPVSTFERSNGSQGKVMRLQLDDGTGQITAVFWNEKTDELGDIERGVSLQILNGRVKEGLNGQLELHVGKSTQIETSRTAKKVKVADIREEGSPITVEGVVATTPKTTQVTTACNEKVKVTFFDLEDNTGKIRVSVWRKLTEVVKNIGMETQIRINNAYVKKGFADRLELTSRMYTSIEILSKPASTSA